MSVFGGQVMAWVDVCAAVAAQRFARTNVVTAAMDSLSFLAPVRQGDIVIVKPNERLPADGLVVVGESSVDQAPVTGESIPVDKVVGDPVFAGTINASGTFELEVTALASNSTGSVTS